MRAIVVILVFIVSLVLMCFAAAQGSWVFAAVCFACMSACSTYMERHSKALLSDIDEVFGKECEFD